MKTIRELCFEWDGISTLQLAKCLEAREKERDAAERERVKSALKEWVSQACKGYATIGSVLDAAYPPPKPETLLAGYWWEREGGEGSWSCSEYYEDFVPCDNHEYRPASDPPPEVTGKAALLPDASRPSYWRGNDDACEKITAILDGKDNGSGVCGEPLEALRRRLLALVGKLKDGGE